MRPALEGHVTQTLTEEPKSQPQSVGQPAGHSQAAPQHLASPTPPPHAVKPALDDLEAVRSITAILSEFKAPDRERILRWVLEKLGMTIARQPPTAEPTPVAAQPSAGAQMQVGADVQPAAPAKTGVDLRTFVASKNPTTDNKFAATIAYYYQFTAPPGEKHDTITANDLTEACRKADRRRIARPDQVLVNSYHAGYFDRPRTGTYKLNSVGENLVAFVLPETGNADGGATHAPRRARPSPVKKSKSTRGAGKTTRKAKA
jgi:hypothetical protein